MATKITSNNIVERSITSNSIALNAIRPEHITLNAITTSNVFEDTNLFFTNARSRSALTVAGAGTYDSNTGIITIDGRVISVSGAEGTISNSQILSGLLTVDGIGSNLDADLLDGEQGSFYSPLTTTTNAYNQANTATTNAATATTYATSAFGQANTAYVAATSAFASSNTKVATVAGVTDTSISNAALLAGLLTVDGSGSGLDADLLDGQSSAYYAAASSLSSYLPLSGGTLSGGLSGTSGSFSGSISATNGRLVLRDDSLENHATASDSGVAVNYYGYQSGTTYFRDFNVYDGKGNLRFKTYASDNYAYAPASFRAPIFYDSNDTGYYVDPRSASVLSGLKLNGVDNQASGGDYILWVNKPNNNDWGIGVTGQYDYIFTYDGAGSHSYGIQGNAAGSQYWRVGTDLLSHNSNIRSPIFYDSNDTAYYTDPASTSSLYDLNLSRLIVQGATKTYDFGANLTGGHYYGYGSSNVARHEIMRVGIDYNDWNSVGSIIIELSERYYGQGGYSKWHVGYGYVSSSSLSLIDAQGSWGGARVSIGSQVQISGDSYYLPIYVDVQGYYQFSAKITTTRNLTDNSSPEVGYAVILYNKITSNLGTTSVASQPYAYVNNGFYADGILYGASSIRSPIFYDQNDTTYYVNPNDTGTSIRIAGALSANYSDERLKNILGPIDNPLYKLKNITGFYYEDNEIAQSLGYKKQKHVGVSAQKVQEVLPEIVTDAPINAKYLTIDYSKLTPLIIEAVKELETKFILEIKTLKKQIADLQSKI